MCKSLCKWDSQEKNLTGTSYFVRMYSKFVANILLHFLSWTIKFIGVYFFFLPALLFSLPSSEPFYKITPWITLGFIGGIIALMHIEIFYKYLCLKMPLKQHWITELYIIPNKIQMLMCVFRCSHVSNIFFIISCKKLVQTTKAFAFFDLIKLQWTNQKILSTKQNLNDAVKEDVRGSSPSTSDINQRDSKTSHWWSKFSFNSWQ